MVAPASSFVSTRTTAVPSFKAPQDATADSAADTERGRAGFYRREEQRQQEDDMEEEDALVPTLHVGARSPYTVGGWARVCNMPPLTVGWRYGSLTKVKTPRLLLLPLHQPSISLPQPTPLTIKTTGDGGVPGGHAQLLSPPSHRPAALGLPRQRGQEERRRRHVRCLALRGGCVRNACYNLHYTCYLTPTIPPSLPIHDTPPHHRHPGAGASRRWTTG